MYIYKVNGSNRKTYKQVPSKLRKKAIWNEFNRQKIRDRNSPCLVPGKNEWYRRDDLYIWPDE